MVCQFWPIQFWPIHFWPILFCVVVVGFVLCVVCCVLCCCVLCIVCCVLCVCVCGGCVQASPPDPPPPDPPSAGPPFRRTPLRRTAQNFGLFFPLPPRFHSFLPLFWSFSLNFGGVFEDRDPQMCTFGKQSKITTKNNLKKSKQLIFQHLKPQLWPKSVWPKSAMTERTPEHPNTQTSAHLHICTSACVHITPPTPEHLPHLPHLPHHPHHPHHPPKHLNTQTLKGPSFSFFFLLFFLASVSFIFSNYLSFSFIFFHFYIFLHHFSFFFHFSFIFHHCLSVLFEYHFLSLSSFFLLLFLCWVLKI